MACLRSYLGAALPAVTNSNNRGLLFPKSLKSTNGMESSGVIALGRRIPLADVCTYTIKIKEVANVKINAV